MSAQIFYNNGSSSSEVITHLINSSDGQGLHFDGAAGNIDIDSPPNLGTKFSYELIIQGNPDGGEEGIIDFGTGGRLWFGIRGSTDKLSFYDTDYRDFSVLLLDDLKVHHLVITIDGTAAILYDNGNQVSTVTLGRTPDVDACTDAAIGSNFDSTTWFDGTIYRARFWNKTLTAAEVTASYENATVPFADQYGAQTDLVVNGTFAADTNWTKQSGWTIPGGNVAHCATTDDYALYATASNQTVGKKYRITFEIDNWVSGGVTVDDDYGADKTLYAADGTYTEEFISSTNSTRFFGQNSVTSNLDIKNVTVREIGCVADYDLAFSNPEISFMVQDRAGAADGEASNDGTNPTGISQVTPLVQVNATAARIGTSAATPADGELAVSGNVGVGGAPVSAAGVARFLYVGHSDHAGVVLDDTNAAPWEIYNVGGALYFSHNGTTSPLTISTTGLAVTGTLSSTGLATFSLGLNSTGNISPTINGLLDLGTSSLAWRKLYVNGIAFQSATTGSGTGTGYTLDSYEEGTFTASLTAATPPTSVPTTTGNYTRIGNIVKIQIRFENADTSGASGEMKVTGLPFTAANNNVSNYDPINAIFFELPFSSSESMIVKNTTEVRFYNVINDAAWGTYNISAGTGKYLFLNGTYTV